MARNEDRWMGVFLAVFLLAAAVWIVVALFNSADLDTGQAGFLRYALLIGLAGILGFGAAHFLGGDRGFAVFLAAILTGGVVWIVVSLLGADLSPGQTTLVRYGVLLGSAALLGGVAAGFFGEDRGMAVFLGAVLVGAAAWITVALFSSIDLTVEGRANFGYALFIGIPALGGLALAVWKDGRERRSSGER